MLSPSWPRLFEKLINQKYLPVECQRVNTGAVVRERTLRSNQSADHFFKMKHRLKKQCKTHVFFVSVLKCYFDIHVKNRN